MKSNGYGKEGSKKKKRVRFAVESSNQASSSKIYQSEQDDMVEEGEGLRESDEEEEEEYLEVSKPRRGAINLDGLREGESSSEEEDNKSKNKHKEVQEEEEEEEDMFNVEPTSSKTKTKSKNKKGEVGFETTEELLAGQEKLDQNLSLVEKDIEPFNFDQDLEEGKFDDNGNFIWNAKDPNLQHDSWLKGIQEQDIEKARLAQLHQQTKTKTGKQLDLDSLLVEEIKVHLANLLQPRTSIAQALAKLGESLPKKKKLSQQKRKLQPKKEEESFKLTDVQKSNQNKIELLTELSNYLVNKGNYDIYQETYESLVRAARLKDLIKEDWSHGQPIPIEELCYVDK